MSVLKRLACMQGRKDEIPNQELARELASNADKAGIREIVENLRNEDKNIQFDCIKVLYEVGYLKPELIADYVPEFAQLLSSRHNRLVWGGMIALSTVYELRPKEMFENVEKIMQAMASGSVITVDNGVKVLARVAGAKEEYGKKIFPYLIEHLRCCRPKEVAQHAESILCAVNAENKKQYLAVLAERQEKLAPAQAARIKRIFKVLETA